MSLTCGWIKKWRQITGLTVIGAFIALTGKSALAQSKIIPDETLGEESSQVETNLEVQGNSAEIIEGGAQRGANLFHSFEEFNVENGRGAYFTNPMGIENIFSRVTGTNPSEISGTLGVQGDANLFFINPNGIIFGENARLDLGGSFVGTTADGVRLGETGQFSASEPETSNLLTVNPSALFFNAMGTGEIINRSIVRDSTGELVGLKVEPGKNLAFIGGNINFEGGQATTKGGNIELGGLLVAGTVSIEEDGSLNFPEDVAKADVTLSNVADIDVRGTGAGNIDVNARNLELLGVEGKSYLRAGVTADSIEPQARAGDITIDVTENIAVDNSSISNLVDPKAVGNAGNVNITTTNLNLINGARVEASTFGRGNAGSVRITSDEIAIDPQDAVGRPNGIFSQVEPGAEGNSGGVEITTADLNLTNGGRIASNTGGIGNSGGIEITASDTITVDGQRASDGLASGVASLIDPDAVGDSGGIEITTTNLNLTDGARIEANTSGRGDSGLVRITSDEIAIDPQDAVGRPSGIFSQVETGAAGNSGGVEITTTNLNLTNGGRIASNTGGEGDAGGVNITASDTITVDGERADGDLTSGIASRVDESGEGGSGDVTITTTNLTMTNGGEIDVDTNGRGNAGIVDIDASNNIIFDGESSKGKDSGVDSSVNQRATGNAGRVNLKATNITMTDGGKAIAGTFGQGDAGEVNITASNNIIFDGEGSEGKGSGANSSVNSGAMGKSGVVNITTANLTITNGGRADASTGGEGNAGEINVTATDTIKIDGEGSNPKNRNGITSLVNNSVIGNSEGITINTKNLILTNGGEISAGTFGQGNSGSIEVTATDTVAIDGENSRSEPSQISSTVNERASGNSGGIIIDTRNLVLTDGGVISASTAGRGNSGLINITASEAIAIYGKKSTGFGSEIISQVGKIGEGNAKGIDINTGSLSISNGGRITANTLGQGNAGNVTINARDAIVLNGIGEKFRSNLSANALINDGEAGNLKISTDRLTIENGAAIEASNFDSSNNNFEAGTGQPGNINIEANSIALTNEARIDAETQSPTGIGGVINLQVAENITMRNGSRISAQASKNANGGNLNIDAQFIIASPGENNDLIANADEGRGGNITINAESLFGIEQRRAKEGNITNDIDASSEFGLSGTVEIDTPDVDRDRDLVRLPERPTEREVIQACTPSNDKKQSEFVIKGSGGLAPSPEDPLDTDVLEVDWISRQPRQSSSEITSVSPQSSPIIEAQGWTVDNNNEIVLVANNTHKQDWQNSPQCQSNSSLSNNSDRILIASTKPTTAVIPEQIRVKRFELEGNQAFDSDELAKVLASFTNRPLSFSQLLQARSAITKYYTERGYITSGAYLPLQKLQDKVVKIQIVEGYLEDIEITGNKRLNSDYLSRRFESVSDSLQQEELLSALQLLQQDPLIASISAELEAGTRPGASVLAVEVTEADSFKTPILLDNRRTPSVGSFRRQLAVDEGNLLGFGDSLFLAYGNTVGSDAFDGSYAVPFNASNGTLTISGGVSQSEVVEEPFNQLNILGDSHYYELSLRQPLIQTPTQEFALGITAQQLDNQSDTALKASILHSLGNVYRAVGNLDRSSQVLEQSLKVAKAARFSTGDIFLSLGNTARARSQGQAALNFYREAVENAASISTRIQAQLNQLDLLGKQELQAALQLADRVESQLKDLPSSRMAIYARINLAENWQRLNQETNSRVIPQSKLVKILTKARQQAEELGDTPAVSYALGNLAEVYRENQQLPEAIDLTQQALYWGQTVNDPNITYRWQWQLGRLQKEAGNTAEAIAAYTEAVNNLQKLRNNLVALEPKVQFNFRERVELVYRELVDLLLDSDPSQENLVLARQTIESLQLVELENFLRQACLEPKSEIDKIVEDDRSTAVVYPIILKNRLEIIVKLPQSQLLHFTTAIEQDEFDRTTSRLRENLLDVTKTVKVKQQSQQLYTWLVEPLETALAENQIDTLVFVSNGSLRNIPISVLYDAKQQQYLIEKYAIAVAPGLQLVRSPPFSPPKLNVLAAGISQSVTVAGRDFSSLANVKQELMQIQSKVAKSKQLIDREFTQDNLQKQLDRTSFSTVHLATHGKFSSNLDRTFILTWDGLLKTQDLANLMRQYNFNRDNTIELLVLSACETAAGDPLAALGLAGIAVRAGVGSTLASLWFADDRYSAEIMSNFYRELSQGTTKAKALQQAQIAVLKEETRPYFWSPFILLGNWL